MSGSLSAMVIFMAWQNAITEIPEVGEQLPEWRETLHYLYVAWQFPKRHQSRLNQTPSKQAQPNAFKADSTKRLQSRLNQTPSKQTQPNAIRKAVIQGRGREAPTLRAPLSGTFLQILPDLVTPLRGHSLSPRSCPATRSAPSERFGY